MRRHVGTRPRRPRGDGGVGLPELLVAMALLTAVLMALATVVLGSLDAVGFSTTRSAATADARTAMDALSRSLRVAVTPRGEEAAVLAATEDGITFYASLDRGLGQDPQRPTRVSYAHGTLAGRTCLVETQVPAADNTGADQATRPLVWTGAGTAKCLVETATAPGFAYFDTGLVTDPMTSVAVLPLAVPATGLPLADRQRVVSVQVDLDVATPGRPDVPPVATRGRTTLVNVALDRAADGAP